MSLAGRYLAMTLGVAVAAFALGRLTAPTQPPAAPHDLAGAIQASLSEGDTLERVGRTMTLLESLEPEDVPGVLAVYERMMMTIDPPELSAFFNAWARIDPDGAIEHALAFPRRSMLKERKIGVRAALAGWAYADPSKARVAAEEIAEKNAPLREQVWAGLVEGWVRADLDTEGLATFLANLRPRQHGEGAVYVAVRELVRTGGAEAALDWVDTIVRDPFQEEKFNRVVFEAGVSEAAASDPARTGAWLLEHAEAGYAAGAPLIVAKRWGRADGAAALEWLGAYPAGESRDEAVREAYLAWWTSDWESAEAWLGSNAQSALHDPAREVWVERLIGWEPAKALAGCELILDVDRRQRCLLSGVRKWYGKDAVAAEEWLQTSPLDEEVRNRVRKTAGKLGSSSRRRRPGSGPS
jgi:hypothetical protein